MSYHTLFLIWKASLGFAFGWVLSTKRIGLSTWQFWVLVAFFCLNSIAEGA
ncbi:hypothetical protein [Paraburkholderia tropica]|uniref:hypothetical protein n=1 Tax=Paraburkholderia tropica TaxID=92647 RepID=UPI000AB888C0|nr:hypothetical protein [Paraburkholderia tropica]